MSPPAGDCGWQRLLFGFRTKSQSSKQHDCESTAHCGKGAEGVYCHAVK